LGFKVLDEELEGWEEIFKKIKIKKKFIPSLYNKIGTNSNFCTLQYKDQLTIGGTFCKRREGLQFCNFTSPPPFFFFFLFFFLFFFFLVSVFFFPFSAFSFSSSWVSFWVGAFFF